MSALRQGLGLAFFIVVCLAVAWIGATFTISSVTNWYAGLRKPGWNPPNWVFGPVWTVLYLSMSVAAWLVWRRAGLSGAALPLSIFAVQLALNLAWSIVFFGRHNIGLALADVVLLWFAIAATIWAFRQVSVPAAWMLTSYLLWVTFATTLNFSIWRLNR